MKPLVWMRAVRDSDLPRVVKITAFALALRADAQGHCWPSYEQIAKDVGADRRDIMRRVKQLREGGWLLVANRMNGHGSQSNSYLLITPEGVGHRPTGGVTPDPPPGGSLTHPSGGGSLTHPEELTPNEVSDTHALRPVDNRHLRAVLGGMARQHGLP